MERFWSKVDIRNHDECWLWKAGVRTNGYGQFWFDGKSHAAHRVAFFLTYGRWPESDCLHVCDNKLCCNPKCLFEGTNAMNMTDKVAKGRWRGWLGDRSGPAKTTQEQRIEIKKRYHAGGITQKELAIEYGISVRRVCSICRSA